MVIFFMDGQERVYSRYGGRDGQDPDSRQSLAGLRYTMHSVLRMHESSQPVFAPRRNKEPFYIRSLQRDRFQRGCIHCHTAKEMIYDDLDRKGQWRRELVYRYPLPDQLGLILDVDRGGTVKKVLPDSPAARLGLRRDDIIVRIADVPIHSFGDTQFALDGAPETGTLPLVWMRGKTKLEGKLSLPKGWRVHDFSWRASMWRSVASLPLFGYDLNAQERKKLRLRPKQLAFRQRDKVHRDAFAAGFRGGDIILGIEGKKLDMDFNAFYRYVRDNYVAGDVIRIRLLRNGKEMTLPLRLTASGF